MASAYWYYFSIFIICLTYLTLNFKYDLQMFQQNSYRIPRYWKWLASDRFSAWRIADIAGILILFSTLLPASAAALIVALMALSKIFLIPKRKYKKPLVFTKRVWRLYSATMLISLACIAAAGFSIDISRTYWGSYAGSSIVLGTILLLTAFSWVPVIAADVILMPVERMIQQRYINDAKRILKSMPDLKIIGITGSYGKTSTKHYLHRILSEKFDVLMTPGSFNTPMGVVRTIRENLKPYNEIFICEMGAKNIGDIKEICDIVHPGYGIVTAVGPMHLESFKSIENVQRTKFELCDSLPQSGLAVINNDFEYCANRQVGNTRVVRYAVTNPEGADYIARDVRYSGAGTTFLVEGPEGFRLELETKLLGECNVSDILAAVCMAVEMGVDNEKIRYAVRSIERVEHRLSINRTPGGVTIIDDAFNSNPSGSKMAVDVLAQFREGRRIIVTPGMIELGSEQYELNKQLGRYIGEKLDIAIVVGAYNRESLCEGIRETGFDASNLHEVESFAASQQLLAGILQPGDTVLYENDLPDTFK